MHPTKCHEENNYIWSIYEDLPLPTVTLEDKVSGVILATPLANKDKRVASIRAWAGARHSRAAGSTIDIMHQMQEKGIDPDQKLEDTFKHYGHASVADMARIDVHFNKVPMIVPFYIFNLGTINAGQEKSTRYQEKFKKSTLAPLSQFTTSDLTAFEAQYQELGEQSLANVTKFIPIVTEEYTKFYHPNSKEEQASLQSRVLDTTRFFLLLGQSSGFSYETSARDWARTISIMKASPMHYFNSLANQLESILAPLHEVEESLGFKAEAPSLIKHTLPDSTLQANLHSLEQCLLTTTLLSNVEKRKIIHSEEKQDVVLVNKLHYSSMEKVVAQYILALWPGLDAAELYDWVATKAPKQEISNIIFNNHTHQQELPQIARTSDITIRCEAFLGEVRDFNRHRALGRFLQMPTVQSPRVTYDTFIQTAMAGYGLPLYLTGNKEFVNLRQSFSSALQHYYTKLFSLLEEVHESHGDSTDYAFALNLLPMAQRVNLWLHFDPKQAHYFTHLRVRPGGHINYRALAFDISSVIANSDPYFSALKLESKPDPVNREEFFSRK